jgi:hypothetical protein
MADNEISREQEVENAVRIAMAFLADDISVPPDDPFYELAQGFNELSAEEWFNRLSFLVGYKVPDVAADEIQATLDAIRERLGFDNWIIAQLEEIRERHHWPEDETVGVFLPRVAATGDEQAKKLMEMGTLDVKTSPRPELAE